MRYNKPESAPTSPSASRSSTPAHFTDDDDSSDPDENDDDNKSIISYRSRSDSIPKFERAESSSDLDFKNYVNDNNNDDKVFNDNNIDDINN